MNYSKKSPPKPPGNRWRTLCQTYTPQPEPGDRVLLRNDEEDMVLAYNERLKMYTLQNHQGLFSANNLIILSRTKK